MLRSKIKPKSKVIIERHDDGDGNWLVSYADMMTLMFGFFVILSALSTPNASKIEKLKKATSQSMGGKYELPYAELSQAIKKVLKDIRPPIEDQITIEETSEGITFTSKGTLFFESGSVDLNPQAAELVESIANVLSQQAQGFRIIVEGHTDDAPIYSLRFPTNWELSAVRASTVVRIFEGKGIPRSDLRPMGLADTEPLLPNRDSQGNAIPQNQAENRRIVMRLQKDVTEKKPSK